MEEDTNRADAPVAAPSDSPEPPAPEASAAGSEDAGQGSSADNASQVILSTFSGLPEGVQAGSGGAVQLVSDSARNVPALPAVRGSRTAASIRERMLAVFTEVADGTRTRMKQEQVMKLNAEMIFLYWTARFDHPKAIMDDKREHKIIARLKENDGDVSEILYALDGASRDDKIMGTGRCAGEGRYDGIETVLRDRGQVERFSNTRKGFKAGTPHPALAELARAARGGGEA